MKTIQLEDTFVSDLRELLIELREARKSYSAPITVPFAVSSQISSTLDAAQQTIQTILVKIDRPVPLIPRKESEGGILEMDADVVTILVREKS